MNTPTFYLTAPLAFAAPATDGTLPQQFSGIAYSGRTIHDWGAPVIIDLASTRVEPTLPLLNQHAPESVIGTIIQATNNGNTLTVTGTLFSDIDDTAASLARKAQRGAAYQMSVGLYDAKPDIVTASQTQTINGQTVTGPVTVLRQGTVREVSIVALGADRHTNAQFFAAGASRPTPTEETPMPDPDLASQLHELTAQVADLTVQLNAAHARAESAETALQTERTTARQFAVISLMAELGRPTDAAAIAPYLALSAESFAAVSADLKALAAKSTLPPSLFQAQATGDPAPTTPTTPAINITDIYTARRVA